MLEYAFLPDAIAIFHITATGVGVVRVDVKPERVRELGERFAESLQRHEDLQLIQRQAAAIHDLLIAPLSAVLGDSGNLVIIPDRELHNIPFAALYDARTQRYVIERFSVSIAPSARGLIHKTAAQTLTPVLVVGDPHDEGAPALGDAAAEASSIAAMYESPTLLSGDRATRVRFIAAAQRSGLIHYAGHADSDLTNTFGTLHLASDGTRRFGDLDSTAIAEMNLHNAPLVILAACGTMRGDPLHEEGMPSIARAFLAAGAKDVIGTLWEVDDDAVAPLFRGLHRELRNGSSAVKALQKAQIACAHNPDPR
ncbi:MAG TPA: CHAT domain-containing protein, partial [Pyrinomonadaceae bacterium]|nr:CHAT domain-containing protein [Pyrinomonadaceae bacterium]